MHFGRQAQQPQMFAQMQMGGMPMQSQTVTRTMNPDGSWTESVTFSLGGNGGMRHSQS